MLRMLRRQLRWKASSRLVRASVKVHVSLPKSGTGSTTEFSKRIFVAIFVAHFCGLFAVIVVVVVRGTPSQELQLPEIQGHRRRIPAERGQGGSIATKGG